MSAPAESGPGNRDGGFATVWAAGAVAALLTVSTLVIWLGAATVTRHRAAGAADLAALAAAAHAASGSETACRFATTVARRMGARIESCELRNWDALVTVRVEPGGPLAKFGAGVARARAGPVDVRGERDPP